MSTPGWLTRTSADVPPGVDWLGDAERRVLAGLRVERRRRDWRLGRFTAKTAVAARLSLDIRRVQILAAADGAPEAWVDGRRAPLSVSLSHRAGRALAAVCAATDATGCDLELVEPRGGAFLREWLTPGEQRFVRRCAEHEQALVANLLWCGKEAAAKVRREGLRLDVRRAVAIPADPTGASPSWRPLRVAWTDGAATTAAWWRADPGWVMVVASASATGPPESLDGLRAAVSSPGRTDDPPALPGRRAPRKESTSARAPDHRPLPLRARPVDGDAAVIGSAH